MRTQAQKLAGFVGRSKFSRVPPDAIEILKDHLLDSIGCAITALSWAPIDLIRKNASVLLSAGNSKSSSACALIGGGNAPPHMASFHNGALVRYVDFMDGFMGPKQSCHPSDNIASLLAAAELAGASGREFLTALAVSYQVQCALTEALPVERSSFDHTVQLAFSISSGVAKLLGLDEEATLNALSISGASTQGLEITRSGLLSNWKGLASASTAMNAVLSVLLAKSGITGPRNIFEGVNGVMDAFREKFFVDWDSEDNFDLIGRTCIKRYNVELHDQSLIEGVLELKDREGISGREVATVRVETFKQAYDITGGGKIGGNKHVVPTKDQADHSIPYAVSAALLDGDLYPDQYRSERISAGDVQSLLRSVSVKENKMFSRSYPKLVRCKAAVKTRGGKSYSVEKKDYEGFFTRPMPREKVVAKFRRLSARYLMPERQDELIDLVLSLEKKSDLAPLFETLQEVGKGDARGVQRKLRATYARC